MSVCMFPMHGQTVEPIELKINIVIAHKPPSAPVKF